MYLYQIPYLMPQTTKIYLEFLYKTPKLLGIAPSNRFQNSEIKQLGSLCYKNNMWWYQLWKIIEIRHSYNLLTLDSLDEAVM